jgi:hypothetical protein
MRRGPTCLRASGHNYLSGGRKPPEFRSSQGAYAPRSGFCPLALTILLIATTTAPAQDTSEEEPIKLTLSPAAAASPALKYQLLPELLDQTPGNAALDYYRAFSPEGWFTIRLPRMWEKIDKALQTPLKDFPRKDLAWLESNHMLRQVDLAARREYVDWGMAERLRRDGFSLLLPDVQGLRQFGALLAARARLEIAEDHYDKAVYTLQTGLALAHHTGNGVILIQDLVGMSTAQLMFAQVEELIQQPGAPNLYWALTELPRPFFDLRKALQGEKAGVYASIPELRTLETTRLTEKQQQKLLQILGAGEVLNYGQKPNWNNRLVGTFLVLHAYPEAKKALIAEGRTPEEVEALPALQVVLIHSWHQYQRLQDDVFKCAGLPYWEAEPQLEQNHKRFRQARRRLEGMPFLNYLPAIQNVLASAVRVDRRIAALRCVEAIRLYAAAHDGKLPATLDTIKEVPLPIDPATGKAFQYRVSGQRATVFAPPPPREKANPYNSLHYELTFRRQK